MTRRRVSFQRLIAELRETGIPMEDIARRCGCSRRALYRLIDDPRREPQYTLGVAILTLHGEVTARTVRT